MRLPLRHLRFLPLAAGTVWSVTLLSLLLYWLAEGRPRYPNQSNPYVAYISDIGAFRLQPLFIVGAILSSLTLVGTILAVHLVLYQRHRRKPHTFKERPWPYTKWVSILACIFALASCPCQICLPVFNNHYYPQSHHLLLSLSLAGTALTALCTTIVFWHEMRPRKNAGSKEDPPEEKLRRRCIISSNTLFIIEVALGTCFSAFLWTQHYRVAGILEWTMSFLFTFYFWAFVGFLVEDEDEARAAAAEETPLLR